MTWLHSKLLSSKKTSEYGTCSIICMKRLHKVLFVFLLGINKYLGDGYLGTIPLDIRSRLYTKLLRPLLGSLGKNSYIHHDVHIEIPGNISIGNNVLIPKYTDMKGMGKIYIGNNILFGPYVSFYTNRHEFKKSSIPISDQPSTQGIIRVGNDSWIGGNVIFLPNISIGNHCVVGAGSVVTKSIPDYVVVVGNPAKIIKHIGKQPKHNAIAFKRSK